jgi:hypothetical protein
MKATWCAEGAEGAEGTEGTEGKEGVIHAGEKEGGEGEFTSCATAMKMKAMLRDRTPVCVCVSV